MPYALVKWNGPSAGCHSRARVATSYTFADAAHAQSAGSSAAACASRSSAPPGPIAANVSAASTRPAQSSSSAPIVNWFATAVTCVGGTRRAAQTAPRPVSSADTWKTQASVGSTTVSASPASSGVSSAP